MIRLKRILVMCGLFLCFESCSGVNGKKTPPETAAAVSEKSPEELMKQSRDLYKKAGDMEEESYSSAYDYYVKALEKLEAIMSKFSSSPLASALRSTDEKVGGYSLAQLKQEVVPWKWVLAMAEEDVLVAGKLVGPSLPPKKEDLSSLMIGIAWLKTCEGDKEKALEILDSMKRADMDEKMLLKLAEAYFDAGSTGTTLKIAESLQDKGKKDGVYYYAVKKYTELNDVGSASAWADRITYTGEKDWALRAIAEAHTKAGNIKKAIKTLQALSNKANSTAIFSSLVSTSLEYGYLLEALDTANSIENEIAKDSNLAEVAKFFAEAGKQEEALKITQSINDMDSKGMALIEISKAYAKEGQSEKQLALLSETLTVANKAENPSFLLLPLLVKEYVDAGELNKAWKIAATLPKYDPELLSWGDALHCIAVGAADAGDSKMALKALKALVKKGCAIVLEGPKGTLREVVKILVAAGDHKNAVKAAKLYDDFRPNLLCVIAEDYIKQGKFKEAESLLGHVNDEAEKDVLYGFLAVNFAKAKEHARALKMVHSMKDGKQQCFIEMASIYACAGDYSNALPISDVIKSEFKHQEKSMLGVCLAKAGKVEKALELAGSDAEVQDIVAKHYLDKGDYKKAVELLNLARGASKIDDTFARRAQENMDKGDYEKALLYILFIEDDYKKTSAQKKFFQSIKCKKKKTKVKEKKLLHLILELLDE